MRPEIIRWWKQGKNDLEKAEILFKSGKYDGTAFFCQQAVEKSLKSLILLKTGERSIEGHSLIHLGKLAEIPSKYFNGLKKLSPQYFISRYPDVTEDVPYELYDENTASEFLDITKEILLWIEKQLK